LRQAHARKMTILIKELSVLVYMNTNVEKQLQEYSGRRHVLLTKRGNQSILAALRFAKNQGITTVYIPQSGGWMTYEPFVKRLKLQLQKIPTENEQILTENLELQPNSAVLLHSLGGYHKTIDTQKIRELADKSDALFIEDVCGTFGSRNCFGHIVVGSFGNAKPINLGKGGFIATNDENANLFFKKNFSNELTEQDELDLFQKLNSATKRYSFLFRKRDEILQKIPAQFKPICDENALVIIVPYKNDVDKNEIISFCDSQNLEYTNCPRYIRHNKTAISIEIKRLNDE